MATMTELLDAYLAGPKLLRQAVAGMSREQLLARPVAGKMSTLEVVCHVVDFDPVYADRMKRALALDRPPLLGADETLFLKSLAYHDRDAEEELAILELTRSQMARILRAQPAGALQRVGVHNERGEMTVEKMLTTITGHVPHHVKFIEEKRKALGL
jgi:hypothetical protein